MPDRRAAFYARVSTESQARDNTIASQITALRERIAADGEQLEPQRWNGCAMRQRQGASDGFTSSRLTAWPAAMRIRPC